MRRKSRLLLLGGVLTVLLAVIGVIIMGVFLGGSEVVVESNVDSSVYIDDKYVGVTPVSYETTARTITLKVIPKDTKLGYLPYESALSLTPHTSIIVRHNFEDETKTASTQILALIKSPQNGAFFTVVTNPPNALIFFNNEYVGTSPLHLSKEPSTYSVQIVHEGFQAVHLSLKNSMGYDLSAYVDLGKTREKPKTTLNPAMVTITKTPVGFLNVHTDSRESSNQIARIFPGHEYRFKSYSSDKKWIEIELNDLQSGWVTSLYASVSGQMATPP